MILSSLCNVKCRKLQGRHCPRAPPHLLSQGNILHLAQRKYPPATTCLRVLMDEPMMEDTCPNISPPSEAREWTASVQVDASLLRFIVGKGGKVKEKIEKDTTTHLQIPPPHEAKRGSCLVVKGSSQVKVDDAVSRIHSVLEEAAESNSLDYSHFISLPLAVHPDLVVQVAKFHDSVMALFPAKDKGDVAKSSTFWKAKPTNYSKEIEALKSEKVAFENEQIGGLIHPTTKTLCSNVNEQKESKNAEFDDLETNEQGKEDVNCDDSETLNEPEEDAEIPKSLPKGHGVEDSIFIKPATLHLTLLMLKLWNKERVAVAVQVLQGLNSKLLEALNHQSVAVRLTGVECMKGPPAKAHVLYARVEDADKENRLLCACNIIKDAFIEAGLVLEKDKKQELKLHATLMNTSYRKRKPGKRFGRRMPFDARPILAVHGSDDWGEYTVTEVHLSQRFVYDEDGYYHCCGSVKLPFQGLST